MATGPVRIGLLVNPIAGLGGRVGLKGTDGAEVVARWRAQGVLPMYHYAAGREVPLRIGFLDDAVGWPPAPDIPCPALVHAGRFDDLVPLDAIAPWAAARPGRELVVWESGHELGDVLEAMWQRTAGWLASRALA